MDSSSSSSTSSSPRLTDLALASLSLADVDISTNESIYSSKGHHQSHSDESSNNDGAGSRASNLIFTCNNHNALVGAFGSRPLQASCLSRTLSSRSTSSNASSVNSNRSVRFAEDKPQVRYTYPKHVYDRAPIRVDERLALKRCRNEEEPRKWVEYLIDDFNSTDALSKYDDYDWSIPGDDEVAYPSVAQLSQLPPLPPSPLEIVNRAAVSKSQIQSLDIFKMSATASSGSDSDSDGSSEGCDIYRTILSDQSPTSTPATSPASSPLSNVLPSGSFGFDSAHPEEQKDCCSSLATPTRSAATKSNNAIAALPLYSPSYSSPSRSIPNAASPNFARWDGMYSSSLPTSLCAPLASSTSDFSSSIKMLQGACPGGNDEKKRLRMERLKLLRERCSAQEDSFECLGGF